MPQPQLTDNFSAEQQRHSFLHVQFGFRTGAAL
jgi:hypothetical protein